MDKVEVKFGEWIEKGFNLYKGNFGLLLVSAIIVVLAGLIANLPGMIIITAATAALVESPLLLIFPFLVSDVITALIQGLLFGPLMVGMILIALRLLDGTEPKPVAGDVFKGFNYFRDAFLFLFVWYLIALVIQSVLMMLPCVGIILGMIPALVIHTLMVFGLFLIADQRMEFWPASMASMEKVKTNFWMFLGLVFVAGLMSALGAILCGVGVVLTFPIYVCIVAVAYREVFAGPGAVVEPVTDEQRESPEGPTPPPPSVPDEPQS